MLNDSYKSLRDDMQNRLEIMDVESGISERKSTRLPVEIVSDFLQENKNYFDSLEKKAESLRDKIGLQFGPGIGSTEIKFTSYLQSEHNIKVKIVPPEEDEKSVKKFDNKNNTLILSEMLTYTARNFHLAYQIGYCECQKIIEQIINKNKFYSDELIALLKISLLNYFSAALLMPYEDFLKSAKKYKYDIEILMHHYAASFEQITHRLTNLQRPGSEGVPFHFLKTDIAGNVSKRFSLSGIEIPRYGGACPRWNIYKAFTMPGKINAAVSKMSNGDKYVCIARTVEKGIGKHGMEKTLLSIGLGCQTKYAKDFVYADSLNLNDKKTETPIGVNCRTCDRMDCQQRAFPPLHKKFDIDLNKRGISVYVAD